MDLLEIVTQSPLKTGLGLLSKKARKKARKKAKRKARKQRAKQAEALALSTGMSTAEAKKTVDMSTSRDASRIVQNAMRSESNEGQNFLMKDYLNLQKLFNTDSPIPTIPVVAGLYLAMPTIKNVLGMGKAPARRRKSTRRRTYRRRR